MGVTSSASTCLLMDVSRNTADEGNIRRIKDVSTNGFLHGESADTTEHYNKISTISKARVLVSIVAM